MRPRAPLLFLSIIGMFMLTQFSASLYLPSLIQIQSIYRIDNPSVKLTVSIFFIGYAIGQLIWGTASDRFGRKFVVLFALGLYVFLSFCLANLSVSFSGLLLELTLLGFVVAFGTSCGNAVLKDTYEKRRLGTMISYVGIGMALAPTISPALGSYLTLQWNWHAVFGFLTIYGFMLWGMLCWLLPNACDNGNSRTNASFLKMISITLQQRNFIAFIVPLGLMFGFLFSYFQAAPFLYMSFAKLDIVTYGWVTLATTSAYLLGTLVNSQLIAHKSPKFMVALGVWVMLTTEMVYTVLLWHVPSHSLPLLLVGFFIMMFGLGLAYPASKAGAMVAAQQYAGTASSLMKFTQVFLSVCITALCSKITVQQGPWQLVVCFLMLSIFSIIWLYAVHE